METYQLEQAAIHNLRARLGHMPVCPKIYLPHGWEADVASVSKSAMVYEFEIKTSRADFLADFKKAKRQVWSDQLPRNKHDAMERRLHGIEMPQTDYEVKYGYKPRKYWTPNYFYFVVPEGLLCAEDVPDYAGLMEVKKGFMSNIVISKKPKKLHRFAEGEDAVIQKMFLHKLTNTVAFRLTGIEYKSKSPQISMF